MPKRRTRRKTSLTPAEKKTLSKVKSTSTRREITKRLRGRWLMGYVAGRSRRK